MTQPLIAVTMGDPAGIGPEIIARAFDEEDFRKHNRAIVVGDAGILERAARLLDLALRANVIAESEDARFEPGTVDVISETELTSTTDYAMMLVTDELKVIHVSTHVSLREAIERARFERELAVIRLAHESLKKLDVESPKVAVAGLNPHAGENGLFGTEDAKQIAPAVAAAVEEGIDATGPHPPDTVMMRARTGAFDIVVVQYHDQGHIPIKLMGFDTGVNVTVGLPFFRTSVDHGTAFDIAGTGEADPSSLRAAIDLARTLAGPEERS